MKGAVRGALRARIVRFAIVGAGAALLLFALTYLLLAAGVPPFAGSVLAYAIAFAVAYSAQRAWTFDAAHGHRRALPRYFAVQVFCALLGGTLAHLMKHWLGLSPLAISAGATIASSLAGYVLSSRWAFAPNAGTETQARLRFTDR